ncbi:hypothetical protein [Herminiimonas arsenitoxidans]|uniref:hypothetical protein n=1 Tax=Herminiimonas arsenitoxidans TaxID=1809410 RepID=UPI0009709FA9|nr:hypothetical protein [Herminiimonas arsenitoxidans]
MANKNYVVVTPLKVPGKEKGEFTTLPEGTPITMDDTEGEILVGIKAIRVPDEVAVEPVAVGGKTAAKK